MNIEDVNVSNLFMLVTEPLCQQISDTCSTANAFRHIHRDLTLALGNVVHDDLAADD
ncbi:hypothetical protein P775_15905 [Puniceibacterium antarcticum]|uniref:Uncharacterized protein n=1 Tax=Puniceibacterium antarcticum TaxID=1206336 RepID=A0A2G8RC95_9RHOB|nr:hypothetical protein [Puniceibacterium antarcticum]PIL19196.1 hypothetical protein P775_15905 [Puniceibacterium antarcticum]